ncbi:YybH family protein [Sphingobium tyrosinilyticum]|uniref:YybH family protein n=1 Tax=Sphingobium tyrosinilyticum TaxID=2715436 RepID=A0ABV9F4L8_9SPHN
MTTFNHRITVTELSNIENWIQVVDNIDDLMLNVSRQIVMADMMLPAWYVGWESVYDNVGQQYATTVGNQHKLPEMNIFTDDNLAAILMTIELNQKKDGKPIVFAFRQLDIFRKRGRHWLATQAHCYVPVDPETGERAPGALPLRGPIEWSDDPLPGPATQEKEAEEELRAWFRSRIAAQDIESLMAHFGPGDDVVLYTPYLPGEHRGLAEIRTHFVKAFADIASMKAEATDYHVTTDGLMAGIIARLNLHLTMNDGSEKKLSVRHSNALRRVNGKWHAMIEMRSFPTDLATGKPVTWLGDQPA